MDRFTIIEDACVIIFSKGVYRQVDVYRRGENYYAKVGAGFVRLLRHNATSVPQIRWYDGEGFSLEPTLAARRAA